MADKSLGRNYFAILRLKQEIENGVEKKPLGHFSCIESTTRFLGLTEKAAAADAVITFVRKKATGRSLTRADGTILTASAADKAEGGSSSSGSAEASVGIKTLSKGNKPIKLITGKPIHEGKQTKHTVSFRFPSWCTLQIVSNALALLLNPGSISATPDDAQIYPFFISSGGKRYPIATSAAAAAAEVVVVATSKTSIAALGGEAGVGVTVEEAQ